MKNILLIIDIQKGFIVSEEIKKVADNISDLLSRELFDVVIATRFLNADNSMYEKIFDWKDLKDQEEQKIPESILKHVDYVSDKFIYNCVSTNFLQKLIQLE